MKSKFGIFLIAAFGAVVGIAGMKLTEKDHYYFTPPDRAAIANMTSSTGANVVENPDFIHASALATPSVVHVKSYFQVSSNSGSFGNPFHGFGNYGPMQATGSGVIISNDGYIATNNHVIKNADKVEVTLYDKHTFTAEVVGTDPTTDLALLKIDASNLAAVPFGDSDKLQVGEWVLAVGNPFNLTSTVTAGIVSAKGRNLNLLNEAFAIESFIQTDAAVNPGNSGGALINTSGDLIGINTAIATETGSYEGYSFAVPVNIVKKVMEDLREYGKVQRGLIGVQIRNIDNDLAEEKSLATMDGAYVTAPTVGGAAEKAGIKAGDVIVNINGVNVKSAAELQEIVGRYRPGDKLAVTCLRGSEKVDFEIILRSKTGETQIVSEDKAEEPAPITSIDFGLDLAPISASEKEKYELDHGVKINKVKPGTPMSDLGIQEGFVITKINKSDVSSAEEVESAIKASKGRVVIEGVSKEGYRQFFAFDF